MTYITELTNNNNLSSPTVSLPSTFADDSSEKCKDVYDNRKQKSVLENSDNLFLKKMKELDNRIVDSLEEKNKTICEMSSFCNSLVPVLQRLPIKKARLAKRLPN